jgi:predicted nucleotidyltransferase
MDADTVIATLRAHRAELEAAGILHAGVFGSVARGEARPDSDIDVLVDFTPGKPDSVFAYAGLKRQVARLFPRRCDVVDAAAMHPTVRDRVMRDLVLAF